MQLESCYFLSSGAYQKKKEDDVSKKKKKHRKRSLPQFIAGETCQ